MYNRSKINSNISRFTSWKWIGWFQSDSVLRRFYNVASSTWVAFKTKQSLVQTLIHVLVLHVLENIPMQITCCSLLKTRDLQKWRCPHHQRLQRRVRHVQALLAAFQCGSKNASSRWKILKRLCRSPKASTYEKMISAPNHTIQR